MFLKMDQFKINSLLFLLSQSIIHDKYLLIFNFKILISTYMNTMNYFSSIRSTQALWSGLMSFHFNSCWIVDECRFSSHFTFVVIWKQRNWNFSSRKVISSLKNKRLNWFGMIRIADLESAIVPILSLKLLKGIK